MYTYIKPLIRSEAGTYETFLEHWRQVSTEIMGLDGLKQYRMGIPTEPKTTEFDGIAELQFETLESLHAAIGTYGDKAIPEDTTRTIAQSDMWDGLQIKRSSELIGEETVEKDEVVDGTDGLYKHSAFLDRKEEMSHEDFYSYWADEHAPIAREVPGVVRYVRVIPTDPSVAPFDGVAELYFEDLDALRAVLGDASSRDYDPDDPKAEALRADAENLHSIDDRPRFLGREFVRIDE